jgi:cell division protein FtsW
MARRLPPAQSAGGRGSRRIGQSAPVPGTYGARQARTNPVAAAQPLADERRRPSLPARLGAPLAGLGAWLTSIRVLPRSSAVGDLPTSSPRRARPLYSTAQAVMATRLPVEAELAALASEPAPVEEIWAEDQAAALPLAIDMRLLATVVCLLVLGTVFIYSASMYQDYQTFGNVNYYITKQIMWLVIGSFALLVGLRFDYLRLRRYTMLLLGVTALLLIAVHIPKISYAHGGAARWIRLPGGQTLQPSEIGKLTLTIYAAHWLSSKSDEVKYSVKGLIPFGSVLAFTTLLIFKQPDLGTAAVVSGAMLGMFFVSGARFRHLFSLAALFLPVAYFVANSGSYWGQRIRAWQQPFHDQQGLGYQISRALLAFWHGGWTGVGLGNGQMKDYIPAANSDSIFATIGEETGLIGALVVVGLFAYFAYRGIRVSLLTSEPFGKLLAAGITTYLVIQAMLNMLSVTNTIPFTGVPLPFISFGGSSLVVNLLAVGVLLNISRHVGPVPEERGELTGTSIWWGDRRPHLPLPHGRPEPERGPAGGRHQRQGGHYS